MTGFDISGPIVESSPSVTDTNALVGPSATKGPLSAGPGIQKYVFKFIFLFFLIKVEITFFLILKRTEISVHS